MIISAPAKVNVNLRILRKREDGFHELETVMIPVPGLADRLKIEPSECYELICDEEGVPLDETNLVTRAVRAFKKETGRVCHYRIELEKVIPHGAGLGGGSSDAASVLLALNELEGTDLGNEKLAEIAGEFGSDTAFFIYRQPCMCRGRGEKVEPVELVPEGWIVLLKPAFAVSTPTAFKAWAGSSELDGVSYDAQGVGWGSLFNDLERPVFEKHFFLAEMKKWLLGQKNVSAAMMSGSGSTMFALVESEEAGLRLIEGAKRELDPKLWSYVGSLSANIPPDLTNIS